jgi:hypothetical protein
VINVTIDDYKNATDISETRLMSLITDMIRSNSYKLNRNKVSIVSVPGIMAMVQGSESVASYSIAACSPDGDGKRGNTIVFIKSFLSMDVTDSFLKYVRTINISYGFRLICGLMKRVDKLCIISLAF